MKKNPMWERRPAESYLLFYNVNVGKLSFVVIKDPLAIEGNNIDIKPHFHVSK